MRHSFVSAAILAFASAVYAQTAGFDAITQPIQGENVPAGQPFNIVWDYSANYTGTISIVLLQGATTSTLTTGPSVASGIENSLGQYTWAVPTSLTSFATYGFKITLDSNPSIFQYSFPFHITGLSGSTTMISSPTSPATRNPSSTTRYISNPATPHSSTPLCSSPTEIRNPRSTDHSSTFTWNLSASTGYAPSSAPPRSTPTRQTGSTSSTSTHGPTNAAVAQVAPGSLAMIGGLVLAFVL